MQNDFQHKKFVRTIFSKFTSKTIIYEGKKTVHLVNRFTSGECTYNSSFRSLLCYGSFHVGSSRWVARPFFERFYILYTCFYMFSYFRGISWKIQIRSVIPVQPFSWRERERFRLEWRFAISSMSRWLLGLGTPMRNRFVPHDMGCNSCCYGWLLDSLPLRLLIYDWTTYLYSFEADP
jgi:hypothetical protein